MLADDSSFLNFTMKPTQTQIAFGIVAVTGVAAAGVAWFLSARRRCSAVKVADLMKELTKPYVHIRDKEKTQEKLKRLIEGSDDKLQLIADFDRTLSKYKHNGKLTPTCHNVLESSNMVPAFYVEQTKKFLETYYPIEVDHNMTIQEKIPYMVEWWTKHHELLVKCNLRKEVFLQIVKSNHPVLRWTKAHELMTQIGLRKDSLSLIIKESKITLRERCEVFFQLLNKRQVPLLIFSAGLGDVIEETIKLQSRMYKNIKIVSNYMDFNHQGVMVGFKGELIHTFNKNENAIHNSTYFEELKHRDNVLLLGDSLGDPRMAEGVEHMATVLKIGFLNEKAEERLKAYMELYDIVVVSDETMDVAIAVLKQIL